MDDKLYGTGLFGQTLTDRQNKLAQQFVFPPTSVFDARSGRWQARKRAWESLGIKGEAGREHVTLYHTETGADDYIRTEIAVSVTDPVLCELLYTWFCPAGGQIVDPFAGDSVPGLVASLTGRRYWGCEIRQEQVEANIAQAEHVVRDTPKPVWHLGDAYSEIAQAPPADMMFTSPPYGDLEVYSDHPGDLSTMPWPQFQRRYGEILTRACDRLRARRFACIVVANFRARTGVYCDLVGTTVRIMERAGLVFWNDAILLTPMGSAQVRAGRQFTASRKLVKVHQNVLVFFKGYPVSVPRYHAQRP